MKKSLTWLGHNTWLLEIDETAIVIDPFLQTEKAPCQPKDVRADYILVSHGHADHCADTLDIAQRNNATLIALPEVAQWFWKKGVQKTEAGNIGGSIPLFTHGSHRPLGQVMIVPAWHSSTMPDGTPGGNPCGFVLSFPTNTELRLPPDISSPIVPVDELLQNAFSVYFACDTGYFSDMSWIGNFGIDIAVLPIGDRYTMGPAASLDAIRAIHPKKVVPSHFGTWKPIDQNPELWAQAVRKYTQAEPVILTPGTPSLFE